MGLKGAVLGMWNFKSVRILSVVAAGRVIGGSRIVLEY